MLAIILTVLVYLEQPHKKELNKLQRTYSEFLKEKDKKIEELQEKGSLLFRTAMKRNENEVELAELKRKWEEKVKDEKPT